MRNHHGIGISVVLPFRILTSLENSKLLSNMFGKFFGKGRFGSSQIGIPLLL
jgi:hypothetical protein